MRLNSPCLSILKGLLKGTPARARDGSVFVPYEQALAAWEGTHHKRMTFSLNKADFGVNTGMCSWYF